MTWYNENDPKTAAWLRELIAQGYLPEGTVDERSIADVQPDECPPTAHFFAGIGGWPLALELAGWPADRPVWTGSCPCQPFSAAGKQRGNADERHLWPEWLRLIVECRPPAIFGEQVASNLGRDWLAGVRSDLEALGYAVGAADLCAASIGAPHQRQRLFWLGISDSGRRAEDHSISRCASTGASVSSAFGGMAHTGSEDRRSGTDLHLRQRGQDETTPEHVGTAGGLGDTTERRRGSGRTSAAAHGGNPHDLIHCLDGAARRVESGTFPLAHGIPARVVRLRGYGNAIVPQVAAQFIRAVMEIE